MEIPNQPSFTLDEVAALFSVSRRSLLKACKDRKVGHRRVGRKITMDREHVVALEQETLRPAAAPAAAKPPPEDPELARVRARVARRLNRERGTSRRRVGAAA